MFTVIIRNLYSVFFTLALPVVYLRLFYRGLKAPLYRERLLERVGIFAETPPKGGLWLHAVSVGEALTAVPLIKAFQARHPDVPVTVTTMTPTGSERVKASLGDTVFHVYLPYDLPFALGNFFRRIQPSVAVIMETELWPNVLQQCQKRDIPVVLANARISDQSIKGYQRLGVITSMMLNQLSCVLAQSKLDGERLLALGLSKDKLIVSGNLKFDKQPSEEQIAQGAILKEQLADRFVWVAASTHNGEDEQILEAFSQLKQSHPNALLILTPRHPERFNSVSEMVESQGFSFVKRSSGQLVSREIDVMIGDTMGEMNVFFKAADVAFVGGSLIPHGGHNLLEPAAHAIPVISGPHLQNFAEIKQQLLNANAVTIINNATELAKSVKCFFESKTMRTEFGEKAKEVVQENQGALKTMLQSISGFVPS